MAWPLPEIVGELMELPVFWPVDVTWAAVLAMLKV
jgi:hypothetical protein